MLPLKFSELLACTAAPIAEGNLLHAIDCYWNYYLLSDLHRSHLSFFFFPLNLLEKRGSLHGIVLSALRAGFNANFSYMLELISLPLAHR